MKRKFLAKAITLGLILAVPLGAHAATLTADTSVSGDTTIDNPANSIIGANHQYDYTVDGKLTLKGNASIKEVKQLTFGKDGIENSFSGGSIEAGNITVKGRLWMNTGVSITTSGKLLIQNNPEIDNPADTGIKFLNSGGTINAADIESQIYFRNKGTIEVTNKIDAKQGLNNEDGNAKINAKELTVSKSFSNSGTISVDSIEASLDSNKNLTNNKGASITAKTIKTTSGGIKNSGNLTGTEEINSAADIVNVGTLLKTKKLVAANKIVNGDNNNKNADLEAGEIITGSIENKANIKADSLNVTKAFDNYGVMNIASIEAALESNKNITNNQGGTITATKIKTTSGGVKNCGKLTSTEEINSASGIFNVGELKTKNLVAATTVTNGGYSPSTDTNQYNKNARLETDTIEAEAIINNANIVSKSVSTTKNIANNADGQLTVNGLLDINGILKNYGSAEVDDLTIAEKSSNSDRDSFSTGSLKVKNILTLKEDAGFSFEGKKDGEDIIIGSLKTEGNNTVTVKNGVTDIKVGTLEGSDATIKVESDTANQITINKNNSTGLTIQGTSEMTDSYGDNISGGLNKLKDTVGIAEGSKEATLKLAKGSVVGDVTAQTNANGDVTGYTEAPHEENAGISEMASIGLMAWRAENNDMNKRLGELRSSKGEHGVWTRMVRGQSKYGAQGIKNQYSTYQLGYDEKLSVDKHWTVGAAVSYTDASSSFTTGHGENKHTGLAVYGSYLGDNGSFVDLIAKVARLKNEFDVMGGAGKGDYETNGYSLSAEYGKRFTKDNGFWIEPQVELTYGYVGAVDYLTSNDVSVRQNGMDSLVGRIGFSIGRDIKAGNVYARASYLYDFDGETDVTFSNGNATRSFKQDLGGGWWEVGVGTNLNLSEATHLYFDVEKTYSGNVATPWQWNAGVRWSF